MAGSISLFPIFVGAPQIKIGENQKNDVSHNQRQSFRVQKDDKLRDEQQYAKDDGKQGLLFGKKNACNAGQDLECAPCIGGCQ